MRQPPDERRVITAAEAERMLGIQAARIRQWAHRQKLYAVSIGADGQRWYKLADVLTLAEARRAEDKIAAS